MSKEECEQGSLIQRFLLMGFRVLIGFFKRMHESAAGLIPLHRRLAFTMAKVRK